MGREVHVPVQSGYWALSIPGQQVVPIEDTHTNQPSVELQLQVWTLTIFFLCPFCENSLICLEGKSMTPQRGNTILHSATPLAVSLYLCSSGSKAREKSRALEEHCVSSRDEGVVGRKRRVYPIRGSLICPPGKLMIFFTIRKHLKIELVGQT